MAKLQKKKKQVRIARTPVSRKEVTRLGSALRMLGGIAGGSIGSLVGSPAGGASVGSSLGAALSKWLGSGDYMVSANSIVNRAMKGSDSIPAMHNTGQSVTIRHREYLGEIQGSTAFEVQRSFKINPGDNNTFPWLSQVAIRFQEYRIKGMVFHYIPSSGTAVSSTNAALGTVMIQTSYRSNDVVPASKVEMLNEYWSSEAVPCEPFCHPIECDPKENPFNVQYVRSGEVPSGDSPLLYDLGVTHVCTSGQQVNDKVLGDLWVSYEIELKKPILQSDVTPAVKSGAIAYTGGSIVAGNWFNGTGAQWGPLKISAVGNTLTFPTGCVGRWLIAVTLNPTTTFSALDLSGAPTLTNCIARNLWPLSYSTTYVRNVLSGTTPALNRAFYLTCVEIKDPALQATVVFPNGVITGACTESAVSVASYDLNFET